MKPLSRTSDLLTQEADGKILAYDLIDNKAFILNETCALVWNLCDGETDAKDIAAKLSNKFKQKLDEDLVWLTIDELRRNNLLEKNENSPNNFAGLNRREVIRKIALSSMIALPIIYSVVAPKAAAAQSSSVCNSAICPDETPTGACLDTGFYQIGCYAIGIDCQAAAESSAAIHCCNGWNGYILNNECCTTLCQTLPAP